MRDSDFLTKYCYNCGKVIKRNEISCPYCNNAFDIYQNNNTIRCCYCRTQVPINAKFCKVCGTKSSISKSKNDQEMFEKLKLAVDIYQKNKYPQEYIEQKLAHYKANLNVIQCYGQFEKAKKIYIKMQKEGILIQTFEFGEDLLKYDEIICCYVLNVIELKKEFNIKINSDFPYEKYILINTTKGFIVLDDNNYSNNLLDSIYYYLKDKVVEFEDSFYNSDYNDFINEKYKKEAEK